MKRLFVFFLGLNLLNAKAIALTAPCLAEMAGLHDSKQKTKIYGQLIEKLAEKRAFTIEMLEKIRSAHHYLNPLTEIPEANISTYDRLSYGRVFKDLETYEGRRIDTELNAKLALLIAKEKSVQENKESAREETKARFAPGPTMQITAEPVFAEGLIRFPSGRTLMRFSRKGFLDETIYLLRLLNGKKYDYVAKGDTRFFESKSGDLFASTMAGLSLVVTNPDHPSMSYRLDFKKIFESQIDGIVDQHRVFENGKGELSIVISSRSKHRRTNDGFVARENTIFYYQNFATGQNRQFEAISEGRLNFDVKLDDLGVPKLLFGTAGGTLKVINLETGSVEVDRKVLRRYYSDLRFVTANPDSHIILVKGKDKQGIEIENIETQEKKLLDDNSYFISNVKLNGDSAVILLRNLFTDKNTAFRVNLKTLEVMDTVSFTVDDASTPSFFKAGEVEFLAWFASDFKKVALWDTYHGGAPIKVALSSTGIVTPYFIATDADGITRAYFGDDNIIKAQQIYGPAVENK